MSTCSDRRSWKTEVGIPYLDTPYLDIPYREISYLDTRLQTYLLITQVR